MNLPDLVEPLCDDAAWRRSETGRTRLTIQVRPRDKSVMFALMEGLGVRDAAFARYVFQRGLETLVMEKDQHA